MDRPTHTTVRYRLAHTARWATLFWPEANPHADGISQLLVRVASIPGVRQHPKAIDIPYTAWCMADVQSLLAATLDADDCVNQPGLAAKPTTKNSHLFLVELARPSFDHQKAAARQALDAGCLLLADQMGLGKTQSAILAGASFTADKPQARWLILAPLFTRASWLADLQACGIIKSPDEVCCLEGRLADPQQWDESAKVFFCHYDVIDAWFIKFGLLPPAVVIADEGHNLRNGRAKRSKGAALAMGPAKLRVVLTGTPMENRPADLWHLLELVCGRGAFGSPLDFRKRYCGAIQGEWGLEDTHPTNVQELRERMAPFYLRRETEDAGVVLPELARVPVTVGFAGKRRSQHAKGVEDLDMGELLACLQHGQSFGEKTLAVLHKLRTLTSAHKLHATTEVVEAVADQGESVVVFTWEKHTARTLFERAAAPGTRAAYLVTGDQGQATRDAYIQAFQESGGVIFATYGALKEGVTLHRARHVVLHDLDWSPSTLAQAEKRIHRIGQKQSCISHWMLCEESIDTFLAAIVQAKMRDNKEVLGIDHGFDAVISAAGASMLELPDIAREALDEWKSWTGKGESCESA